jgi:prepilin-type processing-associated H-X9-DG protein
MYATDNDGWALTGIAVVDGWWSHNSTWEANPTTFLYGLYEEEDEVFRCPSHTNNEFSGVSGDTWNRTGKFRTAPWGHPAHPKPGSPYYGRHNLDGWNSPDAGWSYQGNTWGTNANIDRYTHSQATPDFHDPPDVSAPDKKSLVRLSKMPTDIIWTYEQIGSHGAWAKSVRKASNTDFYGKKHNLPLEGDDVAYYTSSNEVSVARRHNGTFNAAFYDGSVQKFEWGSTEPEDWTGNP